MLFKITDGETHWVSAENWDEAFSLFFASMDYKSKDDYLKEHGEMPRIEICVEPHLRVTLEGPPTQRDIDERFPPGTAFCADVPFESFNKLPKGLVCSTVF